MTRKQIIPDFIPVVGVSLFDFGSYSIFKQVISSVN
jgi:hypothetical protein